MGEKTGISWCDHTFNPWIGCQKVSSGCENCYAARDNKRYKWVNEWGKDYRRTSETNWKKPIQWAKQAVKDGIVRRVFCASLADVFDENVPKEWQEKLWSLILETNEIGGLEWLILTKRPENIIDFIDDEFEARVKNVRIGVTCENQEMADKRMPILLDSWHGKNFISVEPMLSAISFEKTAYSIKQIGERKIAGFTLSGLMRQIDWIICGCESGSNARPCNLEWVRDIRDICVESNIPFFLKQLHINGKLIKEPYLDSRQWMEYPEERNDSQR